MSIIPDVWTYANVVAKNIAIGIVFTIRGEEINWVTFHCDTHINPPKVTISRAVISDDHALTPICRELPLDQAWEFFETKHIQAAYKGLLNDPGTLNKAHLDLALRTCRKMLSWFGPYGRIQRAFRRFIGLHSYIITLD